MPPETIPMRQPTEVALVAAPPPLLWTLEEVARQLNISYRQAQRLLDLGMPGIVRIGRKVLVRSADLADWVNKGCPLTVPKPAARRRKST
jgi:excisionase family DNA binding protein